MIVTLKQRFEVDSNIYQALPKQVITGDNNQLYVTTQMLIIEDRQLIIFNGQENYIAIFDEKKNKMNIINTNEIVYSILLFEDQQHLLAGTVSQVQLYQIYQDINQNYQLALKQAFNVNITITYLQYLKSYHTIIILSIEGNMLLFDYFSIGSISQRNQLSFEGQNFLIAQISQDERYLFVCLVLKNIAIFQIEIKANTDGTTKLSSLNHLQDIQSDFWIVQIILFKSFIYFIDPWQGLYFADLSSLYQNGVSDIQSIKLGLGNVNLSPTTFCLTISNDEKYLYLGVRSQGILVYDISTVSNPILYYQIFVEGQPYFLLISNKGNTLYYSNSNGLYQYQQTSLSFVNDPPNLYNSHKSKSLFDGPPYYKWRCQISKQSNILYAAFDSEKIQRFQIIQNSQIKGDISLKQIDTIPYEHDVSASTPYIETVCLDKNEEFLYVPVTDEKKIVLKYQIQSQSNLSTPLKYIKSLEYSNVQFAETLTISQDSKYLVLAYCIGVMIVDIQRLEVLSLLTIVEMQNNCYGVDFSRDSNYIFSTARNYGIWVIDSRDKKNPFIISVLRTKGAETVRASQLYDIMYCMDGVNGLLIFDTSVLPEVKIIGRLKIQGWANDIVFLNNENFGIISTMDLGMISLINLVDKNHPFLVSKFQIGNQNSFSSCVDPNMQFLFILNSQSVRYFPFISDVKIHYEFSIKQNGQKSQLSVVLNQQDFLQVGQTYELRLIPLYQQPDQEITEIYFLNQHKQVLPSWINQINKLFLEMAIPKEAIDFSNNQVITLLVQNKISLQSSSFIYNSTQFEISQQLSHRIYQYLKTIAFINSQDFVTDLFNSEVMLSFNDFGNDITDLNQQTLALNLVRNILQNSIDYNPIKFKVQSSLNYIIDKDNKTFSIHSISNQVNIQLSFSPNSSFIFVQKEYPNVISYRDDQNTTLNIQSSVESMNNILRKTILYHRNQNSQTTQNNYKQVKLTISDNLNSDIHLSFNVEELIFLKLKQEVKQMKGLQEQIQKISNDNSFAIESTLLIQFDKDSFIDSDNLTIRYQLLISQNDVYSPILNEYFLKFDEQNLRITGTPQASNLFDILHLRLVVSNGYNKLDCDFYIKIYKISLAYLLNLLLKYVGPVAFVLGIYRYKSYFLNIILKNKTFYSHEVAQVNRIYRKKITLIENELTQAHMFLNKFLNQNISERTYIQKKYFQNYFDLNSFASVGQDNMISSPIISNKNIFTTKQTQLNSIQFYKKQDNKNQQHKIQDIKKSYQHNFKKSTLVVKSIKKATKFRKSKHAKSQQKNISLHYSNLYSFKQQKNDLLDNKEVKRLSEVEEKIILEYKTILKETKQNKFLHSDLIFRLCYSHPQEVNNFLQSNNQSSQFFHGIKNLNIKISSDELFSEMVQNDVSIKFQGDILTISDFKKEYSNKMSRFNYCLNAKVVEYLLSKDIRTQTIYSYLKEFSKTQMNFTDNDWYKEYVNIIPTNEKDSCGMHIPFSDIQIRESNILNCLGHLDLYISKYQIFDDIWQYGISPVLLKQALIFDSLGLLNTKSTKIQLHQSKGESIFIQQQQIFSVEAFKLKKQNKLNFLKKILNLEYERLPISKYQSLPNWIQLDCKNGIIILEGIPSCQDQEEILIRIYNIKNCIIMQFLLKIIDDQSEKQATKLNIPLFPINFQTDFKKQIPKQLTNNSVFVNISNLKEDVSDKIIQIQNSQLKLNLLTGKFNKSIEQKSIDQIRQYDTSLQSIFNFPNKENKLFVDSFQQPTIEQQDFANNFSDQLEKLHKQGTQIQLIQRQNKKYLKDSQYLHKSKLLSRIHKYYNQKDQDQYLQPDIDQMDQSSAQYSENKIHIQLNNTQSIPNPFSRSRFF